MNFALRAGLKSERLAQYAGMTSQGVDVYLIKFTYSVTQAFY
jgi:hypothetical protein